MNDYINLLFESIIGLLVKYLSAHLLDILETNTNSEEEEMPK